MVTSTTATGATAAFTGAISGLDTTSLIQAMLDVEKAPLATIATKRTSFQAQRTAYEQLRTLLGTFQTKVKQFTLWNQGGARSATSSNTGVLTATSGTGTVAGTYQLVVSQLATSTVATSTAAIGRQLSDADLGTAMTALPLAGTVTGGTAGIVVDGAIVHATVNAGGTLGDTLEAMRSAIETRIRQTDAGATVTVSANGNKVGFAISGATSDHAVSFGAGGDTSNAAAILGLAGVATTTFGTTSGAIAATSSLGVVRTSTTLDAAGLTGAMPPASTGTLTINGTAIAYDTSVDTLTGLVGKINGSTSGVIASLDRANDRLVLTARTGGTTPITISDTGPLAAALNLHPDTTQGQVMGQQAQISVDGRAYTSDTNSVSTAIDGVKINLLSKGSSTLTIGPDTTAVTKAAQDVVDAYNALADALDTMTANGVNQTKGPLASDSTIRDMAMSFRGMLTGYIASGSLSSLADVGITSGAIGSKVGSTTRLQLDSSKLSDAIGKDPSSVATLFGNVMRPIDASLKLWTQFGGTIDTAEKNISNQLLDLDKQEAAVNLRVSTRQAALEAKFAAMEKILAEMQTTTTSLNNTIAQQNRNTP